MSDRAEWLAERRKGIGGSDIASVFNVGYGCARRLFYDKRDVPLDFPREETDAMALGTFLEPWFAEKYAKRSDRHIGVLTQGAMVHPSVPELRVNVDRVIFADPGENSPGSGVLEIKSVGRAMFYKIKREGLPEDYILQLQHGMLVTGCTWGSFAIGSRDSGELLWWDVDRSEALHQEILIEGPKFWARVENGPAPDALEPDDRRCQRCEYRVTCQGNALVQLDTSGEMPQVESLRPLVEEYQERQRLYAEAEALLEETKEELKTTLGERQAVMVGKHKVYYRPQAPRVLYKGKELLEAYISARNELARTMGKQLRFMEELEPTDPDSLAMQAVASKFPDLKPPEKFTELSKPSRPLKIF